MKKIIIQQNKRAIEDFKTNLKDILPQVQHAFDEFQQAEFYTPSCSISQLLSDLEEIRKKHLLSKIRKELKQIPGLVLNEKAALQTYQLPATPQLDNAVTSLNSLLSNNDLTPEHFILEDLKSGKKSVKINPVAVTKFTDQNTLYAETKAEIEAYHHLKAVLEACTDFDDFIRENDVSLMFMNKLHPIAVARWFKISGEGYTINERTFTQIKRNLRGK